MTRVRSRESGFVLVMTSAAMIMLLAFVGLAVDVGYLQFQKRRVQSAADAAAQGGAWEIRNHQSDQSIIDAARHDSSLNGFTHGSDGVTVTVNHPPTSGYYSTQTNAVEVIVSQTAPTYFMKILGFNSAPVSARAVARATSSPNCVYVLDSAASGALMATGNGTAAVQCGIVVDSTSSTAVQANGNGCITATAITVVGSYSSNSNGCGLQPTPTAGSSYVSDPLSYLTAPTVGACNYTNYAVSLGVVYLSPGVYCGGITVSGAATVVYFSPGTYILNGGGLNVSGQANLIGTGVTFYNTGDASHAYAPVSLTGGSITALSAPTTGDYAAILFFQDRSITSTSVNTIAGGTATIYDGAFYFPTTPVRYSGNSLQNGGYTLIVADTLTFAGLAALSSDYSTLPGGSPIHDGVTFGE